MLMKMYNSIINGEVNQRLYQQSDEMQKHIYTVD